MKPSKISLLSLAMIALSITSFSQKIRVKDGDKNVLKNESTINIEFTFDNLAVGKFDKEQDYIDTKKAEYNKKEPGRGDTWAKRWKDDQENKFPPDFKALFEKTSGMTISKDAKLTMIVHTVGIEPGFNVGVMRRNANIDVEVLIVETANKDKVLLKLSVDNSPGRTFMGNDYDTGERISEAYAKAGKEVGKYLK
ncbi:MAG: hypothetical protein QM764_23250 [Chitinophagaceae bacterium]